MSGNEAFHRVWMRNTGHWNPARKERFQPVPGQHPELATTAQNQPPQATYALPEDTQPVEVSRDRMLSVITHHNLLQPFAN
jgi:hypothetical protein